ncbi:FAD binding domain-containing protein [Azospirillum sp. sgz302134]
MHPFGYTAARTPQDVTTRGSRPPHPDIIAGGTDLLQLLKERVRTPAELIDINGLDLRGIEEKDGNLRVGALVRMSELAADPRVRRDWPVVAKALMESASTQVRNLATIGGNLLQRTRCPYFRDVTTPCNKRDPDSDCSALDGLNRIHAILGVSDRCIAAHPSDLAVALVALDARVSILGPDGEDEVSVENLYRLPGNTPHLETVLQPGDLITAITIPASAAARHSHYVKVRDRATFEWALVSAAVALEVDGGTIRDARVAVGGVGTKPWRLRPVESLLLGRPPGPTVFEAAADRAADGAQPRRDNAYKVEMLKRTVARALMDVGGGQ